ncbi:ATP-binding protein [Actinoplanes sp. NPDC051861]|uniref:sensor histidine kinase n=1 Tax=Actinoplanes sp. NPDC051861 TaxID=3155170 RepID=UPI003445D1E4
MSLRIVGFAVLYLLVLLLGRLSAMTELDGEAVISPAAGVAAVWLVMRRESPWRWVDVTALGALTAGGLILTGMSPDRAAVDGVAAVAAATVFSTAAGRWLPGLWNSRAEQGGRPLSHLVELWRIILIAVIAALAGSVIETVGERLLGGEPSAITALMRLVRDVVGVLIFGVATRRAGFVLRGHWKPPSGPRALECAAIFLVSAGAYWLAFGVNTSVPIGFALLPLTVWAALRMPTPLLIAHSLVFSTAAALLSLGGSGQFGDVTDAPLRALLIELYLGVLAVVGLALALSRDERDALIQRLRVSEQEATEKADMMTTVVNSMTEGLAILDQQGRFVLRNPAAGRLLGNTSSVSGGVLLGSDYGFFHPDGTPVAEADMPWVHALAGQDVPPMDILIRNAAVPEGRIVRFNVARLSVQPGGPIQVVVVFHDVTADRRHRDELMSFAGLVAHDLLNPLTTIEGWAEVLEAELAGYRPAERVTRIQRAAARMRTFLNGLLAYTAARDGKLMPTTVNLPLLMQDIVNSRLDQAEYTGKVTPLFETGGLDGAVEADPVLVRQLLENLIDNALDLMPAGATPQIGVSCQAGPNGMLRIDILDNGIGLPPGKLHEVFTSFHRGDEHRRGSGLELAVCKRIVERHGGTIEAMANPYGSGTRMSFTLPSGRSAYARTLESQWAQRAPSR